MKSYLKFILLFIISGIYLKGMQAQTWSALGSGLEYPPYTFTVYNGNLYTGSDGVYKWDGSNWIGMNEGLSSLLGGGTIYALAVSNGGTLYCGGAGFFVLTPDQNLYNYAGRWNGSKWTTVGNGTGNDGWGMDEFVSVMTSYNGQLIAGGNFGSAGGDPLYPQDVYYIAGFAGTSCCWSPLGSGMNDWVRELVVDTINGVLYAAGYFTQAGGVSANHIAKWDGNTWSALGTGTDDKITALCIHNGELYAGGLFTTAGDNPALNVAKWNGSTWSALGPGLEGQVYDLISYNGNLYAGGEGFWFGDQNYYIAKWNGNSWSVSGLEVDDYVNKFYVFNDELYVGGAFLNAGVIPANHVAKFSDGTGVPTKTLNKTIKIYPNPTCGKFTIENKGELIISNLLGKEILSQKLTSPKSEIDLSNQSKGIYFVKVCDNGIIYSAKIIIQ